jgi:hypothetical protein
MTRQLSICSCACLLAFSVFAADADTKFVNAGDVIFSADFDDGKLPEKPFWRFRKTAGTIKDGVLSMTNDGGNGPFIRLHSKTTNGPLPEDYIMTFSFKATENPEAEDKGPKHDTDSLAHRFSLGHYDAKFGWKAGNGMSVGTGHSTGFYDKTFSIKKNTWYYVTIEVKGDEVLTSFKDGPSYYLKAETIREKPSGFEFFVHADEIGHLDNVKVYALGDGTQKGWEGLKASLIEQKLAYREGVDKPAYVKEKKK